jgi:hypothetical protein
LSHIPNYFLKLLGIIWAVGLVGLFLTSYPPLSELTGALVAPVSTIPILIILCLWVIPYILKRGSLPVESKLLFTFLLFSIISSAHAFFIQIPTIKDVTIIHQELRAYLTLAIGLSFYFVVSVFPKDEPGLRKAIRWINIGGLILVLATLPQVYYILTKVPVYPKWIYITTDWLTKRTPYFFNVNRVSGYAYEPSWFGHQMILFFLPLWLAASVAKVSAFRFRILKLSLENILLILGSIEFLLSAPRISLVGVLLIGIFLAIMIYRKLVKKLSDFMLHLVKKKPTKSWQRSFQLLFGLLIFLCFIIFSTVAFLVILKRDARMDFFFLYPLAWKEVQGVLALNETSLLIMANRMAFLERAIYWFAGLHVFNQYPWLGVGLGNTGFFFLEKVPAIGWNSYEILQILYDQVFLPNTKSLFIRLLAETGLVGFSVFMLFLYNLWRSARLLNKSFSPILRLVALMGQFSLLAFIGEGFSIDSFAMPYLWVFTGLISAAAFIYRQQIRQAESARNLPGDKAAQDLVDPGIMEPALSPTQP